MAQSILIAAPEGEVFNGLTKGLTNYGYDVLAVHNGQDVIKNLKSLKSLCGIILNSELPVKSTLNVSKDLAQINRYKHVPLFILIDGTVDKNPFFDCGVYKYIEKPYSSTEIMQSIKAFIAENDAARQGQGPNLKQQMVILAVIFFIFFSLLTYFILIPMFSGKM